MHACVCVCRVAGELNQISKKLHFYMLMDYLGFAVVSLRPETASLRPEMAL